MRRRLPPLNSLRVFETVARHLSVTKAADELSVTPAAVSHQIKTIEDHLGLPLFQRNKGNLLLTDAGQAILPGIRGAFEQLASAIEEIDNLGDAGVLTISVAPSFAAKWLLPRLDRFQARYPEIDVRVAASMSLADFHSDGVDLAIRCILELVKRGKLPEGSHVAYAQGFGERKAARQQRLALPR
jgi:LysR family glycine cleavage system transcriptional activator